MEVTVIHMRYFFIVIVCMMIQSSNAWYSLWVSAVPANLVWPVSSYNATIHFTAEGRDKDRNFHVRFTSTAGSHAPSSHTNTLSVFNNTNTSKWINYIPYTLTISAKTNIVFSNNSDDYSFVLKNYLIHYSYNRQSENITGWAPLIIHFIPNHPFLAKAGNYTDNIIVTYYVN